MTSELKRTRNNPDSVKFKKEPKDQHSEDDEIEIVEQMTGGQIPFKTESNNNTNLTFDFSGLNKRITRLESENRSLLNQNEIKLLVKLKRNKWFETKI